MNASKESAQTALEALDEIATLTDLPNLPRATAEKAKRRAIFIQEFLETAYRKLPSEAAFNRDKRRSKE